MNLNELAKEICKREGKKKQTDIAQVKEVLRVTLEILKDQTFLVEQDLAYYIKILVNYAGFISKMYFQKDPQILVPVPAPVMQGCKINKKGNVVAKKKPKAKRKPKKK